MDAPRSSANFARLGPRQREFLNRVCQSNGGGVSVWMAPEERMAQRLRTLGLVQGKAGCLSRVVHTREGWALWKSWQSDKV